MAISGKRRSEQSRVEGMSSFGEAEDREQGRGKDQTDCEAGEEHGV